MSAKIHFLGAAGEVTGSLHLLDTGRQRVLLDCGLLQGGKDADARNREAFPFEFSDIDAVVLSHAHIDHSGRIPLLYRRGYRGPVFCQNATRALCEIMLPDSGYLNEKDAEWENRHARDNGRPLISPLYTMQDARDCLSLFRGFRYGETVDVAPGIRVTFHDAGHILGSSIVELQVETGTSRKSLVFSGDLGYRDAPVMEPAARLESADAVIMESTYGDRLHKPFAETMDELGDVFENARASRGNIVIPAFAVGRTQDLLYLMEQNYDAWNLAGWHIFLDSPMAIEATAAYAHYRHLYGAHLFRPGSDLPKLPNFHETASTEESMAINRIESGAIIIAGSGMCTGGRIRHHLKNNIWRKECHLMIVGYQAYGTLGRRIVDGAETIMLWGQSYRVRASVHTIGGLSAHADQQDLLDWYGAFRNRPAVYLVHGERPAQKSLSVMLQERFDAPVAIASPGQVMEL